MTPLAPSQRLQALPRYLFAELERRRAEAEAAGREVIDISIGDPDLPTPPPILEKMAAAAQDGANHRYPSSAGMLSARREIANWFAARYGVTIDPAKECAMLIGSKEGIGHFPLAVLNPGDEVLMPNPGYPVYFAGAIFAGATPVRYTLRESNGFLPDLAELDRLATPRTRVVWVNYPNNPTGAMAPRSFYEELAVWAERRDLIIASDAAYSELYYGDPPPSALEIPAARARTIEFHSFSKTFNMTGWRLGFAVGAAPLVESLVRLKANVDSGAPQAIQIAASWALNALLPSHGPALRAVYRERRDAVVEGLKRLGCPVEAPGGAFYVWARVPEGEMAIDFATRVFEKTGVMLTPGVGFGDKGEGYFRIALTASVPVMQQALRLLDGLSPWKAPHGIAPAASR
ncbi:MAG: aminotransferase class I/II-fold pyridoxal phosphate-dependent enzyme [Candidatus Eisenbacteria bacterium]